MAEYYEGHHRGSNPGGAFLAGILIGTALGLLFAPRRGAETREMLRMRAQQAKTKTDEIVGRVKEATGRMKGAAEESMQEMR